MIGLREFYIYMTLSTLLALKNSVLSILSEQWSTAFSYKPLSNKKCVFPFTSLKIVIP